MPVPAARPMVPTPARPVLGHSSRPIEHVAELQKEENITREVRSWLYSAATYVHCTAVVAYLIRCCELGTPGRNRRPLPARVCLRLLGSMHLLGSVHYVRHERPAALPPAAPAPQRCPPPSRPHKMNSITGTMQKARAPDPEMKDKEDKEGEMEKLLVLFRLECTGTLPPSTLPPEQGPICKAKESRQQKSHR
ncbi:hypothetical protein C8R47DRAFT_1230362 [Mycena vitilis]|nr:hypothetical protein C8R47DRAFT_1230362 [Mycena vitilis]